MARASHKMSGGVAKYSVIEHPYYLKEVPMNPYVGTVHDGFSTGYGQGFQAKFMPFLYRFRLNILPAGKATGFYSRNPSGKNVHWLEVSTIEKVRIRIVGDEAFPAVVISLVVFAFTAYHLFRLAVYHPDLTMYQVALFTAKPHIVHIRHGKKHPLDEPVFRFVERAPSEFFGQLDPQYELYRNEVSANDPWLEHVKKIGKEKELLATAKTRGAGDGSFGRLRPADIPVEDKSGHKCWKY